MTLIGPTHSSQFIEWHNLGITKFKHAICAPNVFLKIAGKPNNYQFYLPNFLKFCDNISSKLLRPSKFLEKFLEILEWSFYRNKSSPSPLLNVVACWKSSNTEACVKKLSQILANNIDNGRRWFGLRINVRYCGMENVNGCAHTATHLSKL